MPTPRPIIATIAVVKSGIDSGLLSIVTIAEPQAHREDRAERDDQDDDRAEDAVDLALGQFELAEEVAAVLHLEALDRRRLLQLVAELADRVAELGQLVERAVADVELRVGDLAGRSLPLGDLVG